MDSIYVANGLTIDNRSGYLYARISHPTLDRETALEVLSEIVLGCRAVRCRHMLIERHAPAAIDDADFNHAINYLLDYSPGIKIALVNKRMSISDPAKSTGYMETGRGANVKYFDNEQAAEQWLLSAN